ncbi:hypothetical protein E2C01_051222 [Portunus trituberculatus]|uniref:Uncharacterized protein n=1 Tax=Portunus trituberculatus TaxID=210409 RepID=A0A5B7GL60_PORTR|nr:hypothetical protein [Portunus trituberculatus]
MLRAGSVDFVTNTAKDLFTVLHAAQGRTPNGRFRKFYSQFFLFGSPTYCSSRPEDTVLTMPLSCQHPIPSAFDCKRRGKRLCVSSNTVTHDTNSVVSNTVTHYTSVGVVSDVFSTAIPVVECRGITECFFRG